MIRYLVIIALLCSTKGFAQDNPLQLTFNDFIKIVKQGHPLAKRAELQGDLGQAEILKSKGGVDPQLFSELNQKQFAGSEYYDLFDAGLKIPTWFGVSFAAGMEQSSGSFLNPENTTPDNGLYYAGVYLPLGKGLFMDERRTALRQAEVYADMTEAQRRMMLNDLLLESGNVYWEWFKSYNNLLVFTEAYQLAEQRFIAVKQDATFGERPIIDTLEASIQKQTRSVQLRQAELDFRNSRAMVEVYLWQDGRVPLELDESITPTSLEELSSLNLLESLDSIQSFVVNHPEYAQTELKLRSLEIDQRWKKEQLKPEINLKYNMISSAYFDQPDGLSLNNYTWGFSFKMPLFLRKERGELKINQVKIAQTEQELSQKQATLNLKVRVAYNEWNATTDLIEIQQKTVADYANLLAGERNLFASGESSLFMVNSREMSYIQSQTKLNDLISKRLISELKIKHSLGILTETI